MSGKWTLRIMVVCEIWIDFYRQINICNCRQMLFGRVMAWCIEIWRNFYLQIYICICRQILSGKIMAWCICTTGVSTFVSTLLVITCKKIRNGQNMSKKFAAYCNVMKWKINFPKNICMKRKEKNIRGKTIFADKWCLYARQWHHLSFRPTCDHHGSMHANSLHHCQRWEGDFHTLYKGTRQ